MESVISTGSLRLDLALRIGGIPRGLITEISGGISSGKTTLCQSILAQAAQMDGNCAFIDADHTFEPTYAQKCGVDLDKLYLAQPSTAEEAFDLVKRLAYTNAFVAIVLDSLTGLISRDELSAPLSAPVDNSLDTLLANWLPQLSKAIDHAQTALIITDQTQAGLSHVYHHLAPHLNRIALPLTAGVRLKLEMIPARGKNALKQHIHVSIIRNKFAPCFKTVELDIIVNKGINITGEILDLGLECGVITGPDPGFYYQGRLLGTSYQEVFFTIQQSPALSDELEQIIRLKMQF